MVSIPPVAGAQPLSFDQRVDLIRRRVRGHTTRTTISPSPSRRVLLSPQARFQPVALSPYASPVVITRRIITTRSRNQSPARDCTPPPPDPDARGLSSTRRCVGQVQ